MVNASGEQLAAQVDVNDQAFLKIVDELQQCHQENLAVMRDGKPVAFFMTDWEAINWANLHFPDALFGIYKLTVGRWPYDVPQFCQVKR